MYKIFLSPSTEDKSFGVGDFGMESFRMNQIADKIRNSLLEKQNYIVYINKDKRKREDIIKESNNLGVDLFLEIATNFGNKQGIENIVKDSDERSNAIGKRIYKNLANMYYDKQIDNEILYQNKKEINSPAVTTRVGNRNNIKDSNWIVGNIDEIGSAIAKGIDEGFKLKVC